MSTDVERGTSDTLTVDDAAPAFEGLLSDDPEYQETEEAQPTQESPESESESEDAEASSEQADEDEDKSEESEESDDTPETPVLYPVKIAGEVKMVTLEEMQKGYSRHEDYTRKTQTLAEKQREVEQFYESGRAEREAYATKLTQLDQALEEAVGKEPDWAQVQRDTPDEFPTLYAQWSAFKDRRAAIQKERDDAVQAVQRDHQNAMKKHLAAEQERLFEAIPEWKKPEVAKAESAKMRAYAETLGFTREELNEVRDHRAIVLLRKAMKLDALEAKKPAINQKIEKVKAATPGGGKPAPQKNKVAKAFEALEKTGSQEAAAAAFMTILED